MLQDLVGDLLKCRGVKRLSLPISATCVLMLLSVFCGNLYGKTAVDPWLTSYQLEARGKYEQAEKVLAPLLDKGSSNELAMLRTGWLKYLQGSYNNAIESYKQTLKLNPDSIDARNGIILPLLAQQRWREATLYAMQVIKESRWNYVAHLRLILAEAGQRKWATLAKHARELTSRYPTDATILVHLARAEAWLGNDKAAKVAYEKVLERVPAHLEAKWYLKKSGR